MSSDADRSIWKDKVWNKSWKSSLVVPEREPAQISEPRRISSLSCPLITTPGITHSDNLNYSVLNNYSLRVSQHEINRVPSRCPCSSLNTKVFPSIWDHAVIEITERATDTSMTTTLVDQSIENNPFAANFKKFCPTRAGGWEGGCQPSSVIRLIDWLIDWWRCQGRGALYCPTWWSPQNLVSKRASRLQPNPDPLNTGSVSGSMKREGWSAGEGRGEIFLEWTWGWIFLSFAATIQFSFYATSQTGDCTVPL